MIKDEFKTILQEALGEERKATEQMLDRQENIFDTRLENRLREFSADIIEAVDTRIKNEVKKQSDDNVRSTLAGVNEILDNYRGAIFDSQSRNDDKLEVVKEKVTFLDNLAKTNILPRLDALEAQTI